MLLRAEEWRIETLGRTETRRKSVAYYDRYHDPLVTWANAVVPHELQARFAYSYHMNTNKTERDDMTDTEELVRFEYDRSNSRLPEITAEGAEKRHETTNNIIPDARRKYQLLPECRTCYEEFGSCEELKRYLDLYAEHKAPYREKECIKIVKDARVGSWVKCHECGKIPAGQEGLWRHIMAKGHNDRHATILPRWREDQAMYNEKERKWWMWWEGRWWR